MKHIVIIFLSFLTLQGQAQSIVNSSGATQDIGGNTYSYSVGEMCAVHTASSASIIVTQGLLQPQRQAPDAVNDLWLTSDQVSLYPNPSTSVLYLEMNTTESSIAQINLLDMNGRHVLSKQETINIGANKFEFDLSSLANANYILQVHLNKSNQDYSKSFKIQKIK